MTTIDELKAVLLDLIRINTENQQRLRQVSDKASAEALEIRHEAFRDVLSLIDGAPLESVTQYENAAITKHVPPLA